VPRPSFPVPDHPSETLSAQEAAPDAGALQPAVEGGNSPLERRSSSASLSRAHLPVTLGTIMGLALPTIVEQFFSAGVGLTDTIVAGSTGPNAAAHAAASAAVGTMTYLQWFAGLMTAALGVGATAIVARSIGAHRPRLATRVAGTVCSAALLVGIGVAILFFLLPSPIAYLFGLRGLAETYGIQYLRIMSLTVCFQTAGQIGMACLRGAGDTVRPMVVTIAVFVVNALASPTLTFGWFGCPAMGIRGNAVGTLLSFTAAGIVTFGFLITAGAGLRLRRRHFRILPHLLKRVLKIGIPSWAEGMLLWTGQALIVMLVIAPTDLSIGVSGATMAAHNAVLRLESVAFLPGFGFGIACSALVGQYLGAKKFADAKRAANLCGLLAFTTMTITALPMVIFPKMLMGWMVDSEVVVHTGMVPLMLAGLAQPGFAIAIARSAALKGAGETVSPMLATITGMILRVILVFTLQYAFDRHGHAAWGLTAVWTCIFIDLNYRAVYNTVVYRRGKWQMKNV
jgi:putative MATE family efflux protein